MSSESRGPAGILSLLAGTLLLLEGGVRVASTGTLPNRALGTSYRFAMRTFPNFTLGFGPAIIQASAILGIVSGAVVLVATVMLASRMEQNAT